MIDEIHKSIFHTSNVSIVTTSDKNISLYKNKKKLNNFILKIDQNSVFKTINIKFYSSDNQLEKKSDFVCQECNGTEFYIDNVRGEKICQTCGLVVDDKKISYNAPRNYQNSDNIYYDVLQKVFKRKTYSDADFAQCSNLSNFKRQISRDGYYSSIERKRNEVNTIFKRFNKELYFQDYIIDQAWKHYKNIENTDLFVGKRMFVVCSALIYISSLQCGNPIQMQKFSYNVSNKIEDLSKKELRKAKNHIFECSKKVGYKILDTEIKINCNDIINTIINYIRSHSTNKSEYHYTILNNKTISMVEKVKDTMKYYGAITSSVPSIMYYISKLYKIHLTYRELVQSSYVSSQTIRKKYKILVKIYGDPCKKNVEKNYYSK